MQCPFPRALCFPSRDLPLPATGCRPCGAINPGACSSIAIWRAPTRLFLLCPSSSQFGTGWSCDLRVQQSCDPGSANWILASLECWVPLSDTRSGKKLECTDEINKHRLFPGPSGAIWRPCAPGLFFSPHFTLVGDPITYLKDNESLYAKIRQGFCYLNVKTQPDTMNIQKSQLGINTQLMSVRSYMNLLSKSTMAKKKKKKKRKKVLFLLYWRIPEVGTLGLVWWFHDI